MIGIHDNDDITFSNLELSLGNNLVDIDNQFNGEHILIVLSGYTGNELNFDNLVISTDINNSIELGDIYFDGEINVLNVVLLISFILTKPFSITTSLISFANL